MKNKIINIVFALTLLAVLYLINYFTYYSRTANTYINPKRVDYITQDGGIAGTNWMVLNHDSAYDKIRKIITDINSYTDRHSASEEELKFLGFRRGSPSFVHIKMTNGDEIDVIKVYNIEILEDGHMATLDEERVLLSFVRNSKAAYYIVKSRDLVDYILIGVNNDIPGLNNR